MAGYGLHLTLREMAKFGYFYLNGGCWEVKRKFHASTWRTRPANRTKVVDRRVPRLARPTICVPAPTWLLPSSPLGQSLTVGTTKPWRSSVGTISSRTFSLASSTITIGARCDAVAVEGRGHWAHAQGAGEHDFILRRVNPHFPGEMDKVHPSCRMLDRVSRPGFPRQDC
jgi:hypothetical protein